MKVCSIWLIYKKHYFLPTVKNSICQSQVICQRALLCCDFAIKFGKKSSEYTSIFEKWTIFHRNHGECIAIHWIGLEQIKLFTLEEDDEKELPSFDALLHLFHPFFPSFPNQPTSFRPFRPPLCTTFIRRGTAHVHPGPKLLFLFH